MIRNVMIDGANAYEILYFGNMIRESVEDKNSNRDDEMFIAGFMNYYWNYFRNNDEDSDIGFWKKLLHGFGEEIEYRKEFLLLKTDGNVTYKELHSLIEKSDYDELISLHKAFSSTVEGYVFDKFYVSWNTFINNPFSYVDVLEKYCPPSEPKAPIVQYENWIVTREEYDAMYDNGEVNGDIAEALLGIEESKEGIERIMNEIAFNLDEEPRDNIVNDPDYPF